MDIESRMDGADEVSEVEKNELKRKRRLFSKQIKARNAKNERAPLKLADFSVGQSENEGNLGDCEDTNNEENAINQDFDSENLVTDESAWDMSDSESSDDDFDEDLEL